MLIQSQVNYSSDGGQSSRKVDECRVCARNLLPNGAYNTIGRYETNTAVKWEARLATAVGRI